MPMRFNHAALLALSSRRLASPRLLALAYSPSPTRPRLLARAYSPSPTRPRPVAPIRSLRPRRLSAFPHRAHESPAPHLGFPIPPLPPSPPLCAPTASLSMAPWERHRGAFVTTRLFAQRDTLRIRCHSLASRAPCSTMADKCHAPSLSPLRRQAKHSVTCPSATTAAQV